MEPILKYTPNGQNPENEGDWVAQLSGDEALATLAFDNIYRLYQPKLSRYLQPFLDGSISDTKEVIQVLFIKLWQKRNHLVGIRNFERYLYRMARNATWDFLKEQKIDRAHNLKIAEGFTDRFEQVDGYISEHEYEAEAAKALSLLPERRRQIFLLSTREDMSMDEIAGKLGLSKAVVKKQLNLASRFLKKYIMDSGRKLGCILFLLIFF